MACSPKDSHGGNPLNSKGRNHQEAGILFLHNGHCDKLQAIRRRKERWHQRGREKGSFETCYLKQGLWLSFGDYRKVLTARWHHMTYFWTGSLCAVKTLGEPGQKRNTDGSNVTSPEQTWYWFTLMTKEALLRVSRGMVSLFWQT